MRTNMDARSNPEKETQNPESVKEEFRSEDLLPLFQLLVRQPPKEHDFRTCPICRRYNIMFGQSKYYVDSLIENVRRGNRAKRERGWMPGMAPIGYLNGRSESGEKIIVSDPVRFPILKQLWKLLLSGGFSVPQLLRVATNEMGLRTPKRRRIGGNALSVSGIYRVFSNPFYAGQLVHEGCSLPGKHEPMITLGQFERAQALVGRLDRARAKKYVFAYTGLMHCGSCGGSITAEHKTNHYGSRYVYYHCTHKKAQMLCREKSIEEGELEKQILDFLRSISLSAQELDQALAALEEERAKDHGIESGIKTSIERALESCSRGKETLTNLRCRDLLTDEEFARQRAKLILEEKTLKERLASLETEDWIELSRNLFLFSNRAVYWLAHGTIAEKRLIFSTIGSNLTVKAQKLNIDANNPFRLLEKNPSISTWCAVISDVRTFFRENPEITIPLLAISNARKSSALKARPLAA